MSKPLIFISYSREDEKEKDALLKHLGVLQSADLIEVWSDDRIGAGTDWQQEIEQIISQANVAILLITANFLTSDFILRKEIPKLLRRRKNRGLVILPIIAKACAWEAVEWLKEMEVRPKSTRPIWSMGEGQIDEALTAIAKEMATIDMLGRKYQKFVSDLDRSLFQQSLENIQAPEPDSKQLISKGQSPYRGLQVFDVEHAPFFFGREVLTERLLKELHLTQFVAGQENRFLAIIGPSGSGKSSLARAGLVAALRRGGIEGSNEWLITIFRPGANPLESLAAAICTIPELGFSALNIPDLLIKLEKDKRTLHWIVKTALHDSPSEHRLVLLVDQFEELYTLCNDEDLRKAFLDNLLHAANVSSGQAFILITLRADFYGRCAFYPDLAIALSKHQVLVGPMTKDELRRAITLPAQLTGVEFETGLVETLLRDVQDQPGSLPLLQHTLLELWSQRKGQRLTHEAYNAIGRLEGALEKRAEYVYTQFNDEEQESCRRIFLRLTLPGEGVRDTKRRALMKELILADGKDEVIIEKTIRKLVDARLVTTEASDDFRKERFVEVAHEALIQVWPRLQMWIEEDREALRIHHRLTEAAIEWQRNDKDRSYLYRGIRLAQTEDWVETHSVDMNKLEKSFLTASLAERRREDEEKQIQQQNLKAAFERLKELDHLKSEFINIAAHELRTPLSILLGYASILEEEVDELQRQFVSNIIRNAARLRSLIDDMLSLKKLEVGIVSISSSELDLAKLIEELAQDLSLLSETQHQIVIDIPLDLPHLIVDRQKLELILINLINNAFKFTPPDGQITIKADRHDEQAIISINNTGITIPKEEFERIFEPFYQIEDSLEREHGGAGLGLSIVRGMVKVCGGEIRVESDKTNGTTFTLILPLDNSDLEPEQGLKL